MGAREGLSCLKNLRFDNELNKVKSSEKRKCGEWQKDDLRGSFFFHIPHLDAPCPNRVYDCVQIKVIFLIISGVVFLLVTRYLGFKIDPVSSNGSHVER